MDAAERLLLAFSAMIGVPIVALERDRRKLRKVQANHMGV